MFKGTSYLEAYTTPDDEVSPNFIENIILGGYQKSKGPVVQTDFGANLPSLFTGMESVILRGLPLIACFDHTQFMGPVEQKAMEAFIAAYPDPWKRQELVVGTSSAGSGFIAHAKRRVWNAETRGYTVEPKPYGYYTSLDQCWEDGYPITELGSANMTTKGMRQVNDVLFIPSKDLAAFYVAQIERERAYILAKQQRWQPFPIVTKGSP